MADRTPVLIVEEWYRPDEVFLALQRAGSGEFGALEAIPSDVRSREFAEWLTTQCRRAMEKGIQLGRNWDYV